ncbi:MAG TPA: acyltransferase [Acidimicrobiales bacterium]|nr:acyltransferase [Acidimicrobiales bacterium]
MSSTTANGETTFHLLGYNRAFDGLRGLAVLMVIGYHFRPAGLFMGGWMGVDLFFALSGFLITALLLNERAMTGTVGLARFHLRRALRLQPALWLFLLVWTAALLAFGDRSWFSTVPGFPVGHNSGVPLRVGLTGVWTTLAEVNNWASIRHAALPPIGHMWSLSIEEQFYLVWPLAVLAVMRLRPQYLLQATVALTVVSALLCPLRWHGGAGAGADHVYFGTDTRSQALLLGALAAQLWASGRLDRWAGWVGWKSLHRLAWVGVVAVLLCCQDRSAFRDLGGFTFIDACSALVVATLALRAAPRAGRVLSWRPLVYAGKRSYAIYLWNYVFATWFHPLGAWSVIPGVAATFIAAELSWRLVESRALGLKDRFSALAPSSGAGRPRSPAAVPVG